MFFIIQENLLLEPMFEVPGSDISTVIITAEAVSGKESPLYIRSTECKSETDEYSNYQNEERIHSN